MRRYINPTRCPYHDHYTIHPIIFIMIFIFFIIIMIMIINLITIIILSSSPLLSPFSSPPWATSPLLSSLLSLLSPYCHYHHHPHPHPHHYHHPSPAFSLRTIVYGYFHRRFYPRRGWCMTIKPAFSALLWLSEIGLTWQKGQTSLVIDGPSINHVLKT